MMDSQKILFCARCFGSSKDSSWNGEVLAELCCNCGCAGSVIQIEECHVKSIRESASWVGKRYYAHQEDLDMHAEIKYAREQLPIPANRHARLCIGETNQYWVTQPNGKGGVSVIVNASCENEAIEKSRSQLPLDIAKECAEKSS